MHRLAGNIAPIMFLISIFALQGCVSTSLEDAAPTSLADNVPLDSPTDLQSQEEPAANIAALEPVEVVGEVSSVGTAVEPDVVTQPEPEKVTSNARVELPPPPEGEVFPTFATTPQAATSQLSDEEKVAIEERMTELLLQQSKDPNKIAQYKKRLAYLRKLAATHAQKTEAEILKNSGS